MPVVFTDKGQERVLDHALGTAAPANYFVAMGTGATAPAVGDTTLQTESAEARVITTDSKSALNVAQWIGKIVSLSIQTITEAGIFDALTVGNMYIRGTFTGIGLAVNDAIEFTTTLELKDVNE